MLDELLDRGRRRLLQAAILSNLVLSGSIFLGTFVLLLIVGTQILRWWIPLVLGLASLSIGLAKVFSRAPSEAHVAQLLDQRCSLSDALATALHFRHSTLELAAAQRRRSDQAAGSIDLNQALPYCRPRSLPALGALALIACSLFLFRYGVSHELALAAPIVQFNFDPFGTGKSAENKAIASKRALPKLPSEKLLTRLGDSTFDNQNPDALQTQQASAVTSSGRESNASEKGVLGDGKKDGAPSDSSNSSEANSNPAKEGGDQPPSSRDGAPQGAQAASKTPGTSSGSGLLSKLKDAVSSLVSKMKPQNSQSPQKGGQQSQQANAKQQQGAEAGKKQDQQGDKGDPSQQQGDESASTDSDQTAPGQGKGKSSDQNASAKPGSGMGNQDGSKELKDAEQLAAMGKLSEIIGKRSANITGEMTIESQSGPQQLKTGYTRSTAKHGESGGDVSRDEVPVALQSYVQQYFEQVRKQGKRGLSPTQR